MSLSVDYSGVSVSFDESDIIETVNVISVVRYHHQQNIKIKSIALGIVLRKVKMIGLDTIIGCLVFVLLVHYMFYIWESV